MTNLSLAAAAAALALFAQAASAETLRIATEGAYPPFNYTEPNGQLAGFDVDIARELCTRLKAECEIVAQDWDGIIPGLLLTALFMALIAVLCLWRPALAEQSEPRLPLGARIRALGGLAPPVGLFVAVMGSIYAGWATPTESAAVGVVAAFLLSFCYGRFKLSMLHACFETTVTVSSMILLIVAAAHVAGVADPEWGQRLCAAVVPADPASPVGENALRAHIRDALGAAAVPKTWLALDALPLLSTGKTDRQALAARFTAAG